MFSKSNFKLYAYSTVKKSIYYVWSLMILNFDNIICTCKHSLHDVQRRNRHNNTMEFHRRKETAAITHWNTCSTFQRQLWEELCIIQNIYTSSVFRYDEHKKNFDIHSPIKYKRDVWTGGCSECWPLCIKNGYFIAKTGQIFIKYKYTVWILLFYFSSCDERQKVHV